MPSKKSSKDLGRAPSEDVDKRLYGEQAMKALRQIDEDLARDLRTKHGGRVFDSKSLGASPTDPRNPKPSPTSRDLGNAPTHKEHSFKDIINQGKKLK